MRVITSLIAAVAGTACVILASAEEHPVALRAGAGLDQVMGNCGACHSLDYIPMNSPFLTAGGWSAEVGKMIKAYGAPISDADAKVIVEYLTKYYGS